ncbi:MAG TPA: HAMP domain-containing sensor histidine kinase [Candidatus Baltobacteraceae bacterium]|nr:HAMP domain-containing sensor histidine kinase [Candidatus Baltobacteraceae bacterium]
MAEAVGTAQGGGTYELPLADPVRAPDDAPEISSGLVLANAFWFYRLRWIVIGGLVAAGCTWMLVGSPGSPLHPAWMLGMAGALALANLGYRAQLRRIEPEAPSRARANLRLQIAVDLVLLTVAVHFVGSLHTFAPFTYLFHIVLACIFFSRRESLAVTGLASGLYAGCVLAEWALGGLPGPGLFPAHGPQPGLTSLDLILGVMSVLGVWLVVWYLASYMSARLEERDRTLAAANRLLVRVQGERTRHMLRTTHELKAPFAAIHANAQLLLNGSCGELPPDAVGVVRRIAERCQRLSREIQEMLQLANLDAVPPESLAWTELEVSAVVRRCLDQVRPLAEERRVGLAVELEPVRVVGVEEHLTMLFVNLISNAILYSHADGAVRVSCAPAGEAATVRIADRGIGIAPEKLPRIFEEYYRTEEAARHNRSATGLGLAIVRQIARTQRIGIRVESTPGAGTSVECTIPRRAMERGAGDGGHSGGG